MNQINLNKIIESGDNINDYLSTLFLDMSFKLEISFESNFNNTSYLRKIIEELFSIAGIDKKWITRFILVSDELTNNSIEYGSDLGEINKLRLVLIKDLDNKSYDINLEIEDTGNGKEAKTATKMDELQKQRLEKGFDNHKSIRGRGLSLIITKLVDDLYFKDSDQNGLIVGINKKLVI